MQCNREEFENVALELKDGQPLTFTKMARVFGPSCYELIIHALLSAEEASYVIREAVKAASQEEQEIPTDV